MPKPPKECQYCKYYYIVPGFYNWCKRFPKWVARRLIDTCGEWKRK